MRTPARLSTLLFFLIGFLSAAQSPEQQQMAAEMQERAEKAMRLQDSIMNTPRMQAMMKQFQEVDQENRAKEAMEKEKGKKGLAAKTPDNNKDFYLRNTISSDTNGKFSDWSGGPADFGMVGYPLKDGSGSYKYIKMGRISADGKITYDLPNGIKTPEAMNRNNNLFISSRFTAEDFQLKGAETGLLASYTLAVVRNSKRIGDITMGNNIKVARNLSAPCCNNYGDEGYRVYWAYASAECAVTGTKNFDYLAVNGESEKRFDRTLRYDLNFKPGWNLIKTESKGYEMVNGQSYYKTNEYTLMDDVPADTRYFFKSSDGNEMLKLRY